MKKTEVILISFESAGPSYCQRDWLWLITSCLICALYMYVHLMRGWVPHDEGTLALTAERVLKGEIPHRDFNEVYTGGLTFCHALAFRLLGVKLTSLRWAVFSFFLAWVPAIFAVARRFTGSMAAGGIAILATAWSLPNYSASMPSWYNLFFATFGIWAAFRFLESRSALWLFWVGLCGGISTCMKISGVYFIASVLFFLIYCQQDEAPKAGESNLQRRAFAGAIGISMLLFIGLLFHMVKPLLNALFFANFFFPGTALAGTIICRELRSLHQEAKTRLRNLLRMLVPFFGGVIIPCLVLLIPYVITNSLRSLVRGVLVAPQARLAFASRDYLPAGPAGYIALALLIVALVAAIMWRHPPKLVPPLTGLGLLLAAGASGDYVWLYRGLWFAVSNLVPTFVLVGCVLLELFRHREETNPTTCQKAFLLLAVVGLGSLIQFPFAAPVYFLYIAPLLWIAVTALIKIRPESNSSLGFALGAAACVFIVLRVTPGFIFNMGVHYAPDHQVYELTLSRAAGLKVDPVEGRGYELLINFVNEHSKGAPIYAGPDSPEIYFLAGKPNPTPTLFDFLDDSKQQEARISHILQDTATSVAVIRDHPDFSPSLSPALQDIVREGYGHAKQFGPFTVYWR